MNSKCARPAGGVMAGFEAERMRLIAITDREALGMGGLVAACRAALDAGLPALMLREKDLPEEQIWPLAQELRGAAAASGALFIINRRIDLARAVGADGVHLGADGPTIRRVRAALGAGMLIGYSAHSEAEALKALSEGADYVTFSPVFDTPSKRDYLVAVGVERLAALCAKAPGRIIALGGVNAANIADVQAAGAAGAALIRPVFSSSSPGRAVAELLAGWNRRS